VSTRTVPTSPIGPELRLLFGAFAVLAVGAFFLLFVLSEQTDDWFSWTIKPPLTAAFLGASYLAALVLFAWTAARGDWASAQATLVPVSVIAVLLGVATIIHDDRFHDDLFGWFWKTAYVIAPIAIVAAVALQLRRPADAGRRARVPLPSALRGLLTVQGAVMLAVGLYLFAAPESADVLWPWNLTPLTARAIGAFVVGFGASALHAAIVDDLPSFEGAALAYAVLGALELVALARYTGDLTGADLDSLLYVGLLVTVLLAGLAGWLGARRLSASAKPASA
jgi:hypothetical protein